LGPGSGGAPNQQSVLGSGKEKEKKKEKQQFGPEVESLKELTKQLVRSGGGMASSKWTWGVDLTNNDLLGLIRGADHQGQDSHTGYDSPLPSNSLQSETSAALDPAKLEDPQKTELWFDNLSASIASIPELPPDEFPIYSDIDGEPGDELVDPEPDLVIEAFTKRAKAEAIKAGKMLMQDEVDRPVSYHDYGSEFIPQIALIPKRPWLMPRLPIIFPPTNNTTIPLTNLANMGTESDADDQFPDVPGSESDNITGHIDIPDSDADDQFSDSESDNITGHIDIPDSDSVPDSSTSSELTFPVSDDHGSDAMDVVRSDEHDIPMSDAGSDSGSDIVFPKSPVATRTIGPSGVMVGIEHDPNTGRFTAASFANFSDELLD
jgi:hypothetical protein